jgi:protoporphyrin/coproporphyrin ferrochelatase
LKYGVLLMAYGSPRTLDEVEGYYTDIRGGRAPSAEALADLTARYARVGMPSPLEEITRRQAAGLERALAGRGPGGSDIACYVGMKHWNPFIHEAVAQVAADGVEKLVGLVLAPHYSKMSIGGYESRLLAAKEELGATFEVAMVNSWYDEPGFIDLVASNIKDTATGWPENDFRVFFTAHSLPERAMTGGDPYRDQLLASSKLIADAAGVSDWEFAFQSASATGEPWLGPDILDRLQAFAAEGGRHALIAPIGFVADHLEILFDVDVECAEEASRLGLELRRTTSPNDDPRLVDTLANVVVKELDH